MESKAPVDVEEELAEFLLSKQNKNEEELEKALEKAFYEFPKTKKYVETLLKLNTISPLIIDAKTTNLDAINDISEYFYSDHPKFNELIKKYGVTKNNDKVIIIEDVPCLLKDYNESKEERLSFRIPVFDNDELLPQTMRENGYLVNNNVDIVNKYGYLCAFGNNIMTDTYISTIIKILAQKYVSSKNYVSNYITFFINENGYQIKNYYELSLTKFLSTIEINEEIIMDILQNILNGLLVLKSNEYGFVHGNLTTDNIFVKKLNKYVFAIGNFQNSSIFYNGIRFANRNSMEKQQFFKVESGCYTVTTKEILTYIPIHASYDVYIFMVSLLAHPNVFNFFNKNNDLFKKIYLKLFTESDLSKISDDISLVVKVFSEKYQSIEEFVNKQNLSPIKINKDEIFNDLNKLDYDKFNTKYTKEHGKTFYPTYFSRNTILRKFVREYYDSKKSINIIAVINGVKLKENINDFYNEIIGTNPSEIIIDANNLPYKGYPGRYFQLSKKTALQAEYHLCIDKCTTNAEIDITNQVCSTNKYTSTGYIYHWDYCDPGTNIYKLVQYKIISRILSYYDSDGTLNLDKLNNDPNWRILLNMIIDNKLMIPHFNCQNDFILRGKLLPVESASRSRQFINISLGNMYDTLQLTHNNTAIDAFVDNIITVPNEKYIFKPILLKLIKNIIVSLNKQAFAKVNAVSNAALLDPYNNFIDTENKIYKITNKLLYNCYTPNISSLLLDGQCQINNANIYNNYLVEQNVRLKDYFKNIISQTPFHSLISYNIFVMELLKTSISIGTLINEKLNLLNNNSFFLDFVAIFVQIAYTLECFNRIGLIHNDLHTGNVFIERLSNPIDFQYVITDETGENIIKIINIQSKYFVRIFDFDHSYTYTKHHKYLTINIEHIPKSTPFTVENDYSNTTEASKYDFSYLCRWIIYRTRYELDKTKIGDMIREIIGTDAYDARENIPVRLKNSSNEIKLTTGAMTPLQWLSTLDMQNKIINTNTHIQDINIKDNTCIYILPDTNIDILSNLFDQNIQWIDKTTEQKINICPLIIKDFESKKIITNLNNLCRNKSATISIDWVRHGESCANLDQGIVVDIDKYPNRRLGYLPYEPNQTDESNNFFGKINLHTKLKAGWKYEPNLSYIGMQHAILLGTNYIKKQKPYNIILCSPLTRTITTALLACRSIKNAIIYVVPYISEVQNVFQYIGSDYQNVAVNSKTLKQRILFMKDWLETNWINNFDDIEVINDLYQVKEYLLNSVSESDQITAEITKLLQCKPSIGKIPNNKFINKYTNCPNTIDLIKKILQYLVDNKITHIQFYEKYYEIMENLENFKRGPPVNFSILEKYEKIYEYKITNNDTDAEEYNTRNPNIYKFYTEILPEMVDMEKPEHILCIAHGSLIRKIWQTKNPVSFDKEKEHLKHMKNTQVFREIINYDQSAFTDEYDPTFVRTSFENFEALNIDVCRIESIKGIINYNLQEPTKSYLGAITKTLKSYVVTPTISEKKMSFDVKFYDQNRYDNINVDQFGAGNNITGSYHKKYLKYRSKYLSLKKIMEK